MANWIDWQGNKWFTKAPVSLDTLVYAKIRSSFGGSYYQHGPVKAMSLDWNYTGGPGDVMAYCVAEPVTGDAEGSISLADYLDKLNDEVVEKLREGDPRADATNPSHYRGHPSGIECIEITEHMGFCLGNAVKYIWRADLKHESPIEDLEKAIWYISREIDKRKRDQ